MYIHIHSRYCTLINYIAEHMHRNVSLYVCVWLLESVFVHELSKWLHFILCSFQCFHICMCVCVCTENRLQASTNLFGEVQKWLTVTDVELLKKCIRSYLESCANSKIVNVLRQEHMSVCVCVFCCQGRSILPITSGNCACARDFVTKVQLWFAWPMCNSFTVFVVVMQWNIKKNG